MHSGHQNLAITIYSKKVKGKASCHHKYLRMMSSVSREAAVGATVLQKMLYFSPSLANVLQNPTNPSLAENDTKQREGVCNEGQSTTLTGGADCLHGCTVPAE